MLPALLEIGSLLRQKYLFWRQVDLRMPGYYYYQIGCKPNGLEINMMSWEGTSWITL